MILRSLSSFELPLFGVLAVSLLASCGGGGSKEGPGDSANPGEVTDARMDSSVEMPPAPDVAVPDVVTPAELRAEIESPEVGADLPHAEIAAELPDAAVLPDEAGGETALDLQADEGGEEVVPPVPGACATDEDCAPWSLVCDPLAAKCVECLFSVPHCPGGWICKDYVCEELSGCAGDEECALTEQTPFCDPISGDCVACYLDEQCPQPGECVGLTCATYTPCESSKQCGDEELCWLEEGKCVGCLLPEDCEEGEECGADNVCHAVTACASDKQCTPLGMVCDFATGLCRQCLAHGDCPAEYNCQGNECVLDLCLAGSAECGEGGVVVCSEVGDGFLPPVPCLPEQTCVEAFPDAICQDWLCPAGASWCDEPEAPETAVTCAEDGLSIVATADCLLEDRVCLGGACVEVVCPLGTMTCDVAGLALMTCVDKGSQLLAEPCAPGTYCKLGEDKGTASCVPQMCPPDQPVCVGNLAATCNGNGSDVLPGGTDCAGLQQQCYKGQCTVCEAAEKCDGLDNTCNGLVDETPADCTSPNVCHLGACYKPTNQYLCKVALYAGHVYQHCLGQSVNWYEAQAACQAWNGSSLITLGDLSELTFLKSLTGQVVWVGYTDEAQEGSWNWLAGDSQFTYFCNNQPDNWQNNEDCAAANFYSGNQGKQGCFNDYACATKLTEYLCEKQ